MKKIAYTLFACLLIGLSSCLEITEQVHLRDNGSGRFTFTVDMSEAKPLLEMAERFSDNTNPKEVKSDLKTGMEDAHARLQSVKGIHYPALIKSENGLLSGITFEFDNVEALNQAMNVLQKNDKQAQEQYFGWNGKQLHRFNTLKIENQIKDEAPNDLAGIDLTINGKSMKDMMKSMVYRTEYTFDKPIQGISNSNAALSSDKKKVILERYLLDDTRQATTLENVIRF